MIALPTLSPDGWLFEGNKLLDRLFGYFLVSNYSQTFMYPKQITSLGYLINTYTELDELKTNVRESLSNYLGKYYSDMDIETGIESRSPELESYKLTIGIEVVDKNGKKRSLRKAVDIEGGVVRKISDVVN